ncbi:hypothetical protein GUJ93_ZPchr0001g32891 [Zizania palustris]|uniref:Uncharacterized protein n=1 Tax=Zizania palustris TaxID=103762 RepID=A0A8J5VU24_ZIZPA|nr:hypothetical protein GUJ93_ZPchr0001g32891 [Zizania palustris]
MRAARFQRSDVMKTFIPTAEDIQALADLQQAVANLRAYLGLASVASTLPIFPYGVTGFLTAPSPPSPHAEAEAQVERKDREALSPILIKEATNQQGDVALVESLRTVTLATPDEESHNGSLDASTRSFHDSTNDDVVDPAPQPLPPSADDDGADPKEEGDYMGSDDEGQEGEDDDEDAMLGGAAYRRDQHAVFFRDSSGTAVDGGEKLRATLAVDGGEKPRAMTSDPIPRVRCGEPFGEDWHVAGHEVKASPVLLRRDAASMALARERERGELLDDRGKVSEVDDGGKVAEVDDEGKVAEVEGGGGGAMTGIEGGSGVGLQTRRDEAKRRSFPLLDRSR